MGFLSIFLALLVATSARALNDWSIPCLTGQCSYDVSETIANNTASGSLFINGSTNAISDLTPAAGWTIVECASNATSQNIRAICTGDNSTCSHLYNNGAINTIVRLPDSCGKMPFARIASEWMHANQSIPVGVAQKLSRRASQERPTVRGITLDTAFSKVDPSHHGQISMLIQGASGAPSPTNITARARKEHSTFSGVVPDTASNTLNARFSLSDNLTSSHSFATQSMLLEQTMQCPASGSSPAFTAGITTPMNATLDADIEYGVVAQGTFIPRNITQFGVFSNFDLKLLGRLTMQSVSDVDLDSGNIEIINIGLPGLEFPGQDFLQRIIFSLGPSFQLNAQASVSFTGGDLLFSTDVAYSVVNGQLFFPSGPSGGNFVPTNTHLQLAAAPGVATEGFLTVDVIPALVFGINAFDGTAEADVSLTLDAQVVLELSLSPNANSRFAGCIDASTSLLVQAIANATFFDVFDKSATVDIFSRGFELFSTCFGSKREHARDVTAAPPPTLLRRVVTCANGPSQLQTLANEIIIPVN